MLQNKELTCSHSIKIKNFCDNEVVDYSLLLIRGVVSDIKKASANSKDNCTDLIHLHAGDKSLCENISSSTGEFKFILDLNCHWCERKPAVLLLHFVYCSAELQIKIQVTLDSQHSRPYRLQPLYILCRDEEENDKAKLHCKIIDLNLRLIQSIYADRIKEAGFPRVTFALNGDCCIYRADILLSEAWAADEHTLWLKFAEEFLRKNRFQGQGDRKLKLIAFIGCTKYDGEAAVASNDFSYANIKKHLQAHAALGGGDLALFGSAFFYAWPKVLEQIVPCFLDQKPINASTEADESNYRRTYGGVYASTLGAVCHEIGHIFDLGHDRGIMGAGFDYVNRVFTINNRTENLPTRFFGDAPVNAKEENARLTRIKRKQNFLEKYREQRENDGFFFTRNCCLILTHHQWFSNKRTLHEIDAHNLIAFNFETSVVRSHFDALKIIEIRSNTESQVEFFYEVNTFEFKIPSDAVKERQTTHHLFVMLNNGLSKRLGLC